MTDEAVLIEQAARTWDDGENCRRKFAEQAAYVSGSGTKILAARIGRSVSTVENYRNAYRLYYHLQRYFETSEMTRMWNELYPNHWVRAAKAVKDYNLLPETIYEHLEHALEFNLSIEAFGAHITEAEAPNTQWIRSVKSLARSANALRDSYMSDVPPDKQRLVRILVKVIERLAKELAG